jgi:hypothetical protein
LLIIKKENLSVKRGIPFVFNEPITNGTIIS